MRYVNEGMPVATENAKTVERAARLLFDLAANPAGFTATELAQRLDTQRPPLYRLLQTLTEYRLIHRTEAKLYTLGIGVLELARAVAGPLDAVARPVMQRAADTTNATAMLLLAEGDALVTVLSITPSTPDMHLTTPVGYRHPDGATAPRVALATLQPASATDSPAVTETRTRGYALSRGVAFEGQSAFAAPVNLGSTYSAAALVLVTIREADEQLFGRTVADAASQISAALGRA